MNPHIPLDNINGMMFDVAIASFEMNISLEHAELYYITKECGKWWSFGKELGIGSQQLSDFQDQFGNFEESLNGRKARVVVLSEFISKYRKTSEDTIQLLTTLSKVAGKLGCHTMKPQIGK